MGCHRSGTNLLYDTLLSAGDFAVYRGYIPVYKILIPRFGNFDKAKNRKKIMEVWLRSKGFRRSGLDAAQLTDKILAECRTGGDFIRLNMDEIAREQGAIRWAMYDPDSLLHMPRIKAEIPNALFVHIIRDGRDIALSLKKMGEFRPFPWNRKAGSLRETALYWEWMIRTGQRHGRAFPPDYIEIHYEDLVSNPRATLNKLGQFIDHDLDYERIQSTGLGRLRETNSSFRGEATEAQLTARPIGRWKERLSPQEIIDLESLVGNCLENVGYELITSAKNRRPGFRESWMRMVYPNYLSTKFFLKINTPIGRWANLSVLELEDSTPIPVAQ
ncbi:MAG TPA: sulfotransferase [Terriglobales bacterium]|nr:sulfotransferase [Terriglobales bacterium]